MKPWESLPGDTVQECLKGDPAVASFLFTLKNPHGVAPRRFAIVDRARAIGCRASWGPHFGDVYVADNCSTHNTNFTEDFGAVYRNDTGLDGATFFTGLKRFTVKEIEVFEVQG
jgi:hypothetical protein